MPAVENWFGWSDGNFYSRTFNGTTFGAQTPVNTQDQIVNLAAWHTDIPNITSMFFDNGRLYYTLSTSSSLFYRYFTPESGVVGASRFTATNSATGLNLSQAGGAFINNGSLYVASRIDGALRRVNFSNSVLSGAATTVSGPLVDGSDWRTRGLFLYASLNGTPVNLPPVADSTINCTGLACTASAAASSDPDGTIVSYDWDFGDGFLGTGVTAQHTYAAAGTYQVKLTVRDNDGLSSSVTKAVTVSVPNLPVSFVDKSGVTGNSTSQQVTVPAGVQTGDGMLLFTTVASTTATIPDPAGWTPVQTVTGNGTVTKVWQRVAAGTDAGTTVTISYGATVKADVLLTAYRGTAETGPVAAFAGAPETASTVGHVTPQVATGSPAWVVSYWADNSSTTTSWTEPAGQTVRSSAFGIGGGHIDSLLTDSGAPVAAGTQGGLTATTDAASAKGTMWTIVLTD